MRKRNKYFIVNYKNKMFTIKDAFDTMNDLNGSEDLYGVFVYLNQRYQNNEIKDIINGDNESISPEIYNLLSKCLSTSIYIERSFSMLGCVISKERIFNDENIVKYMMLYCNSSKFE